MLSPKHLHNQRGIALILEVAMAALALAVIGGAMYVAISHAPQPVATKASPSPSASASPAPATLTSRTITTDVGSIKLDLPDTWTSSANGVFMRTIGDRTFRLGVQLTDTDYLKGVYGGSANILKNTELADGTTSYVIKTANSYVALSSCIPADGKGCSLVKNGRPVLIFLNEYHAGDQYVRELTFNDGPTQQAITEFEAMATSLEL
jgi:hypothetical protein